MRAGRRLGVPALALAGLVALAVPALARFVDSETVDSNTFSAGVLQPPTDVSASDDCVLAELEVTVSWTATDSPVADGYEVLRSTESGGPYSKIGEVLGLLETELVDTEVSLDTTYHYVVRTFYEGWTSADSNEASVTTVSTC